MEDGEFSAKIIWNMFIRLNTYTSSQRIVIPFIEWRAGPTCEVQEHWPAHSSTLFPKSVTKPNELRFYKRLLAKVLMPIIKQPPWKTKVITKLNSVFPQSSVLEQSQRAQDLATLVAKLKTDLRNA